MSEYQKLLDRLGEVESKVGYAFKERGLLALAFTHRSFVNEHHGFIDRHNERLEFFGDSVLGVLIAEHLYLQYPEYPEGELSLKRSALVDASACMKYVEKLGVEVYLLLGRGEQLNGARGRESILSDLFEALMGAIYLDGGLEASRKFLFGNFQKEIEEILDTPIGNWKSLLQNYTQGKFRKTPCYIVLSEEGPDHCKEFCISVSLDGRELGRGMGTSKKEAQQSAAFQALVSEGVVKEGENGC
ncbi:ribonuclease III [Simkania negevensis]|uniref:Ribonuclease 3 n=1 Tax=Simkania negevensis TaxID=83561 RepID=A0ABS3AR26_9BACT|nr:ribonuclease III [Simkania negevensis]